MKAVRITEPQEALADIRRRYVVHPLLQQRVRVSGLEAAGSAVLGWYRGHMAGIYDAYLTLKETHPKVAKDLLKAHKMRVDGSR